MSAMASLITGVSRVCSTVCSGADQRKHQASRPWPLWGEYTGGFPSQRASNFPICHDVIVYSRDDIKQTGVNITHWNGNVIILTKFSPLAAPKVVKMTASSAVNDGYFIEMSCLGSYSVEEGKKFVKMNILSLKMRRHTWVKRLLIFYCLHDGTRTKVGYVWYIHIESTLWLLMAWQARHHQLWYWLTYYPRNIPV